MGVSRVVNRTFLPSYLSYLPSMLGMPDTISHPSERESPGTPREPLTRGSLAKGEEFLKHRDEAAFDMAQLVTDNPGSIIGLRVVSRRNKEGMFFQGQRGVVTDIHRAERRVQVVVTWDNFKPGMKPTERVLNFAPDKLLKYVRVLSPGNL